MKDYDLVELQISEKSKIQINYGMVLAKHEDVVLIFLDLRSKYIEVGAFTWSSIDEYPGIILDTTDKSMHLNENETEESVEVRFPEYAGFYVWNVDSSRYNVRITLLRKEI